MQDFFLGGELSLVLTFYELYIKGEVFKVFMVFIALQNWNLELNFNSQFLWGGGGGIPGPPV